MNASPSSLQRITVERSVTTATVTLSRPDLRNAFDDTTIVELTAAFRALSDDPQVRVIVLAANGPAFCAGADLELDEAHGRLFGRGESRRRDAASRPCSTRSTPAASP